MSELIKRLFGWSSKKKETERTTDKTEQANSTSKTIYVKEPVQYFKPPQVKKETKTTQVKESGHSIQLPQIKNTNIAKKWKTIHIFISSTFLNMHAERDHLVKVVFPELRERCALRHLHLIDVDLRWGSFRLMISESKYRNERLS